LNRLADFHEICYECDAIQWGLDAVVFNSISSTILKWLKFKFQIFSLAQQPFGTGNQGVYITKGS
jgi:hypothetical protein